MKLADPPHKLKSVKLFTGQNYFVLGGMFHVGF